MNQERRTARSPFCGDALEHWLSSLARKRNLAHAVLADAEGLVVAASTHEQDEAVSEGIAARAPFYIQREDLTTFDRFYLDGEQVYLCIVGDGDACAHAIGEAQAGIKRIFEERAAA